MAGALKRHEDDLTIKDVGRSLINSVVLVSASAVLLGVSCVAFLFFYHYNVPAIAVNNVVYLQHSRFNNPYAHVSLEFSTSRLALSQPYDVVVELILPNTPSNHEIGNFMVQLDMLSAEESLITSSRPAIMRYSSPLIDTVSTVLSSGPILLGLRQESQVITVPVLDGYVFEAGWLSNPSEARIELHAPDIKVYSCRIMFQTRLQGLSWILYNFRVTSFIIFTTMFWISSMIFMMLSWASVTFVIFPEKKSTKDPNIMDSMPPTRSTTPEIKLESPVGLSSGASASGSRISNARSFAASSLETESFFKFEDDTRRTIATDATSLPDSDDQYIKRESESDSGEFI